MANTEPGENRVTYNNLPPGKYTFQVRALNYGNYSETRTVKILITPPWYQTWWAYVDKELQLCFIQLFGMFPFHYFTAMAHT